MNIIETKLIIKHLPAAADSDFKNSLYLITSEGKFVPNADAAAVVDIPTVHNGAENSWGLKEYLYVKWDTTTGKYIKDTTKTQDAEHIYKVSPNEIVATVTIVNGVETIDSIYINKGEQDIPFNTTNLVKLN